MCFLLIILENICESYFRSLLEHHAHFPFYDIVICYLASTPPLSTFFSGQKIKSVASLKYLGLINDENLSLKLHIQHIINQLSVLLRFYVEKNLAFLLISKRGWWNLLSSQFLLYRNAPAQCLHLCLLYSKAQVGIYKYIFIHKAPF